jgi:hypothetical protein
MTDSQRSSAAARDENAEPDMTIEEAAAYFNVIPARLCGRCQLVFHSVVNKRIHDKLRHKEKVDEVVEVEAGERYCMECNATFASVVALCEHVINVHGIRVKVVIRGPLDEAEASPPECLGCGRQFASFQHGSE